MSAQRPNIILDCDPGVDDALAILVAHRYGDLRAITTVNGNVSLSKTTANALGICQIAGIDVPVHAGAPYPMGEQHSDASHVHGSSGLAGVTLPPPDRTVTSDDAVGFLLDYTVTNPDHHLIAVGPLTNVALALEQDPTFAQRVASITFMGGATAIGNATAVAEFNTAADPEAAAIVLAADWLPTMVGLNLTRQVCIGDEHLALLRAAAGPSAAMAAGIIGTFLDRMEAAGHERVGAMHDPCAVLAVTHPDLFEGRALPAAIELTGTHTRGMTVVDRRPVPDGPATAHVLERANAAALDPIIEAILRPHG